MELSIDTASELASIALSTDGRLAAEITWRCRRNHTVELLPAIETLLAQAGVARQDITAVFVCTGPGMYTGLRVGISVAKGLAYARAVPIAGVGRLELDAYPHAAFPGDIVAVHRAGRGELAWAAYRGDPWREISPPQLSRPPDLAGRLRGPALLVGEIDDSFAALLPGDGGDRIALASAAASVRHASALAELGFTRLMAGLAGDALLRPVYLRPLVIGPQPATESGG